MIKILTRAMLFAAVICFAHGTCAAETKWFIDLDSFLPGKVAVGEAADMKQRVDSYRYDGATSASYVITTPAAIGGRVGVLWSFEEDGDLGISLGYVAGPISEVKSSAVNLGGIGVSNLDYSRELSFARALVEYKKEYPTSDKWVFTPGFGVGMAFGATKIKFSRATNAFAGYEDSAIFKWSGLTWEATAGFGYKMDNSDLNFAVRYAAFPSYKGDSVEGMSKVDWSTIGFSIGVGFGGGGSSTASQRYYKSTYKPRDSNSQNSSKIKEDASASEAVTEEPEAAESYETYVRYAEEHSTQGDYVNALKEYDNALSVLPENDEREIYIWERKGTLLSKQKGYLKARGAYTSAIKAAKNLGVTSATVVNAYLGLAYCFEKSSNKSAAIMNYNKALELSSSSKTKVKIRQLLKRLKAQPK